MKKIFFAAAFLLAMSLSGFAEQRGVFMDIHRKANPNKNTSVDRAPMYIDLEAFYDSESQTISVCYDGECEGEVYLYLNETVVGYDSEINTSFQISSPGLYKIEVISESWIATGYIQL